MTRTRSVICSVAAAALVTLTASCGDATAPACGSAACDAELVVFGRGTVSWSGMAVPGATVAVQLFADTTRKFTDCAGTTPLATAAAPLDTAGNYRVAFVIPDAASHWACAEVTGDPHGWASDVGMNHLSGGLVQLRAAADVAHPDSLRVDFTYSETP